MSYIQYGLENIKDDIEDKSNSVIYEVLNDNNIVDIDQIFSQFTDIVNKLNHKDNTIIIHQLGPNFTQKTINETPGQDLDTNININHNMIYQNHEQITTWIDTDYDSIKSPSTKTAMDEKKEEASYEDEWEAVYQNMGKYTECDSSIYGKSIDYYKTESVC